MVFLHYFFVNTAIKRALNVLYVGKNADFLSRQTIMYMNLAKMNHKKNVLNVVILLSSSLVFGDWHRLDHRNIAFLQKVSIHGMDTLFHCGNFYP